MCHGRSRSTKPRRSSTGRTRSDISYGTALGATQLNATASFNASPVPGNFVYTPVAGTVLNAVPSQLLSVAFTPANTTDFNGAIASAHINVNQAALMATAADAMRPYGANNPTFTGTLTGVVNNDNITVAYTTTATSTSAPGTYAIMPVLSDPNNRMPNYLVTLVNGALNVTKAATATTIISSNASSVVGEPVTFSINVTDAATGSTGTPTGTVTISDGTAVIGMVTLDGSGNASFTTALLTSAGSPHTIKAHYNGDSNFLLSDAVPAAQTVSTRPTTASLSFNPAQGTFDTPDTITATVTDTATAAPTGTPDSFAGAAGSLATGRKGATATQLLNGLVLVVGGQDASSNVLASAELYNPATGTSTPTGARARHRSLRPRSGTARRRQSPDCRRYEDGRSSADERRDL